MRKAFTTTIEQDIQKQFKKTCIKNKVKMNDVLEAFMRRYIAGEFEVEMELKFKSSESKE